MIRVFHLKWFAIVALSLLVLAAAPACSSAATAGPGVQPPAASEPGWPRQIDSVGGPVTIAKKPERIHVFSLGLEEITLSLVPVDRMAAVSTFAVDPIYSNVVDIAKKVPKQIGRDAEAIVAADPDVVVAGATLRPEVLDRLRAAGIAVVVNPISDSIDNLPKTIDWLASIYGEEANGRDLRTKVEQRLARLDKIVASKPLDQRPTAVLIEQLGIVAGKGANRDALLQRAGARNVVAEAGIEGDKQVNSESLIAMNPQVVILEDHPTLAPVVRSDPAFNLLPAVQAGRVYSIPPRYLSTLSQWQIRGAEEIAKALWPADFAGVQLEPF
jgi:iron complex transport system substrate-binding protein